MPVILRMRRMCSSKSPFYRIVAADNRFQRDGRFLEILGYYDPKKEPFKLEGKREKVMEWLHKGAQMSQTVESLLRREGIVQEFSIAKANSKSSSISLKEVTKSEEKKPVDEGI